MECIEWKVSPYYGLHKYVTKEDTTDYSQNAATRPHNSTVLRSKHLTFSRFGNTQYTSIYVQSNEIWNSLDVNLTSICSFHLLKAQHNTRNSCLTYIETDLNSHYTVY